MTTSNSNLGEKKTPDGMVGGCWLLRPSIGSSYMPPAVPSYFLIIVSQYTSGHWRWSHDEHKFQFDPSSNVVPGDFGRQYLQARTRYADR